MKNKWNMHELHSMLVQEEARLKNQGSHSVHYVSHQGNQGAGKKFMKKHDKGKGSLKINTLCKSRRRYQRIIIANFIGNLDIS